eukprot:2914468-Pyramimonas_sp.AAC.1
MSVQRPFRLVSMLALCRWRKELVKSQQKAPLHVKRCQRRRFFAQFRCSSCVVGGIEFLRPASTPLHLKR